MFTGCYHTNMYTKTDLLYIYFKKSGDMCFKHMPAAVEAFRVVVGTAVDYWFTRWYCREKKNNKRHRISIKFAS